MFVGKYNASFASNILFTVLVLNIEVNVLIAVDKTSISEWRKIWPCSLSYIEGIKLNNLLNKTEL